MVIHKTYVIYIYIGWKNKKSVVCMLKNKYREKYVFISSFGNYTCKMRTDFLYFILYHLIKKYLLFYPSLDQR